MVSFTNFCLILAASLIGFSCKAHPSFSPSDLSRVSTPRSATGDEKADNVNHPANHKLFKDLTTDLKRIPASNKTGSTQNSGARMQTQDLIGDSSDEKSSLSDRDSLLDSSSSQSFSLQSLPGHRRFDDATLALASTGPIRGNGFLLPHLYLSKQDQEQLLAATAAIQNFNPKIYEPFLNENNLESHKDEGLSFKDSSSPKINKRNQEDQRQLRSRKTNKSQLQQHQLQQKIMRSQRREFIDAQDRNAAMSRSQVDESYNNEGEDLFFKEISDGDDIFKDDVDQVNKRMENHRLAQAASPRSSSEVKHGNNVDESNDDEDDSPSVEDGDDEGAVSLIEARPELRSRAPAESVVSSERTSRKPLKGIEDSTLAAEEQVEPSNLKAKRSKSTPAEVELVVKGRIGSDQLVDNKSPTDLQAAAGHHHHGHGHGYGHYYQYVEVPKKKAWKMGFKRGNHKHTIARHEKGYKNKFHSSFKWHAKEKCKKHKKCHSTGKMTWHYEHHDKKKKHHY